MHDPGGSIHHDAVLAARRAGHDSRTALLRMLIARHLARPQGNAREQERLTLLAIRLLGTVDMPTAKRTVAELSTSLRTPYALALHIARGPIALAAPMLRLSPVLDEVTLLALADTASPTHAAAIAARREVSPLLAKKLASAVHEARSASAEAVRHVDPARQEAAVMQALAADEIAEDLPAEKIAAGHISAEPDVLMPAPPSATMGADALPATGEAFFAANDAQRAVLFELLANLPPLPLTARLPLASAATLDRLEQAALRHQPAVFASLLEKALGVSERMARAVVADRNGEAIVVACRAIGMNFETVARVLFFLNPDIGRSVARVFGLAHLFEALPEASAQHLVATWRAPARRPSDARLEDAPSMRGFTLSRRSGSTTASDASERRRG